MMKFKNWKLSKRKTLVKRFKCGCELHQHQERAWTIYCQNHGKNSYPKE